MKCLALQKCKNIKKKRKERIRDMSIGINITDDARIELGDSRDKLIKLLDGVKYSIPYDKENENGVKSTLVQIEDLGMGIQLTQDKVTYIRSDNNKYSNVDNIQDIKKDPINDVKRITSLLEEKFTPERSAIKIENLNISTMQLAVVITYKKQQARAVVQRDAFGDVYVNTLRSVDSK